MLATPVARVVVDRCQRHLAAERPIVSHVSPQSGGVGLAVCQHRDGRVIAVQPLTGEGMRLDQAIERHERRGAGLDLVSQGRNTLANIAIPLTIEGLGRAELGETIAEECWARARRRNNDALAREMVGHRSSHRHV